MDKKRPVLSISMLVSNNRRDTIEKCMESLVPLMKAVPSELIIVDTGCTDGSVDIARKYADKVVQFTWCKDFSAARNAGLVECTGEWFLYLDDDEWFEDVSALIAFFQSKGKNKCDALWYLQRNYDSMEGTSYTDAYVGRCVKMTPETRFCGKIHEWIEPLPTKILKTDVFVHHYGYVYKSEGDRQKHLERNLTLEEEAVRENPNDMRMCCQLVQEYRVARRYEDALALCKRCIADVDNKDTSAFIQYLRLAVPKIYKEWEKYDEALFAFEDLEKNYSLLHQTRLGLFYDKAMLFGCIKQEEKLVQTFLRYLKEFNAPKKAGEPDFPVMDFAQYQSDLFKQRAVEYAVANMICGDVYSYAKEVFSYIDWEKNTKPKDMLAGLFRCYEETGDVSLLAAHLPTVLRIPDMEEQVYGMLHSLYEKYQQDDEKSMSLLEDLESLKLSSGNFPFFHLLYTERKGITKERDIRDYYEKSDRKYDEEVALLLLGKSEKKLLQYSEQKKIGSITGALKEYIACAKAYADAAYGPEFWEKENPFEEAGLSGVPGELGFAHTMERTLEETNGAKFGEGVKQALKLHPTMLPAVRVLLEEREVLALAEQLKAMIRAQLAEGKAEEAKEILSELAMMLPEDEEVKELLGKI